MRILIISAVFPPEPVVSAKLSFDLCQELHLEHNITVISPRPSRPQGFNFERNNAKAYNNHIIANSFIYPKSKIAGRLRESYSFGKFCSNYIDNNKLSIDLVYINSWPFISQFMIAKTCKKLKIKTVLHVQDMYPESLTNKLSAFRNTINSLLIPLDKYILKHSTQIIAISNEMKEHLIKSRRIDKSKFTVVANWQDHSDFNYCNDHNEAGSFTFMYLGNIGPVASIDLLIDSFAKMRNNNCSLIIAGAGSMRDKLIDKVKTNNYSNIQFLEVPFGKVGEIQSKADVLLLPVKKGAALSSVPSKLPAYMFSRKPIIASVDKESSTAKAIKDANCGWIIEPESVESLTEVMENAVALDRKLLSELGENGYKYGIQNFSKEHNLPKLIDVLYKALEE